MSSEIQARGPLDGRQIQANGVRLAGLPSAALVNVRGPIADAAIDKALKRVIGCQRPTRPNSIEVGKAGRILWLGPDEWLVELPTDGALDQTALEAALASTQATVCAVGAGLARVSVEGSQARWLLAAGSPLAGDRTAIAAGDCAQTRLAHASVIVVAESADALTVLVRRSMAGYLWQWFEAASARLESAQPAAS